MNNFATSLSLLLTKLKSILIRLRSEMERLKDLSERIEKDLAAFKSRVEFNEDGSYKNRISLDNVQKSDPQLIGKTLNQIVKSAVTGKEPQKIGSIYGFDIVVKSERTISRTQKHPPCTKTKVETPERRCHRRENLRFN